MSKFSSSMHSTIFLCMFGRKFFERNAAYLSECVRIWLVKKDKAFSHTSQIRWDPWLVASIQSPEGPANESRSLLWYSRIRTCFCASGIDGLRSVLTGCVCVCVASNKTRKRSGILPSRWFKWKSKYLIQENSTHAFRNFSRYRVKLYENRSHMPVNKKLIVMKSRSSHEGRRCEQVSQIHKPSSTVIESCVAFQSSGC